MKKGNLIQPLTPFLWFNYNAEEAVKFYTSIFNNSKTGVATHYGRAGARASGMTAGAVMTIPFELNGQRFVALNGGPQFQFTHAISFAVTCETQEEIDYYWEKLSEGGEKEPCGWVRDKFGMSWQVVPSVLEDYLKNEDGESEHTMEAMLKMKKIDIAALTEAYNGSVHKHVVQ